MHDYFFSTCGEQGSHVQKKKHIKLCVFQAVTFSAHINNEEADCWLFNESQSV